MIASILNQAEWRWFTFFISVIPRILTKIRLPMKKTRISIPDIRSTTSKSVPDINIKL